MSKSKHNYSQYSKKPVEAEPVVVEQEVVTAVEEVVEPVVEPTVKMVEEHVVAPVEQIKPEPISVTGVVTGCVKLNVRTEPKSNADVVCVINANSELKIDMTKSNSEWLRINTASGVEGYCMRKFVNVNL